MSDDARKDLTLSGLILGRVSTRGSTHLVAEDSIRSLCGQEITYVDGEPLEADCQRCWTSFNVRGTFKTDDDDAQEPAFLIEPDPVNHPQHYGGDTAYEVIKVIEAWGLGFHLGNAVKYIARAGKKGAENRKTDLDKARWYIERYISMASDTESLKPDVHVIEKLWQEYNHG